MASAVSTQVLESKDQVLESKENGCLITPTSLRSYFCNKSNVILLKPGEYSIPTEEFAPLNTILDDIFRANEDKKCTEEERKSRLIAITQYAHKIIFTQLGLLLGVEYLRSSTQEISTGYDRIKRQIVLFIESFPLVITYGKNRFFDSLEEFRDFLCENKTVVVDESTQYVIKGITKNLYEKMSDVRGALDGVKFLKEIMEDLPTTKRLTVKGELMYSYNEKENKLTIFSTYSFEFLME